MKKREAVRVARFNTQKPLVVTFGGAYPPYWTGQGIGRLTCLEGITVCVLVCYGGTAATSGTTVLLPCLTRLCLYVSFSFKLMYL